MPFLFNEDDALFQTLAGITVSDGVASSQAAANPPEWGTRNVGVFFQMPDKELRDANYPFITLDLIGIREDTERTHRGIYYYTHGDVQPESGNPQAQLTPPGPGNFYSTEWPTPLEILYQITTFARTPQHDRQIMSDILYGRIPFHYGAAATSNDGRVRRLVLQDVRSRDRIEGQKRIYSKSLTVAMSSEIYVSEITGVPAATTINFGNGVYDMNGLTTHWIGRTWGGNYWQNELGAGTWNDGLSINWINNFVDPSIDVTNG